ncbi:MAG: sulfotransferase domain-containing protein [Defluviitaleaceae bacterium]|nr:sulfotransferase domain-containing protein [Defluviitaleaceae bacterium]
MQKIVGVCGFHSTGSSAVVDLLHEFEETQVIDDFELTILHRTDGLADLDYYLNSNRNHMVGVGAISRFKGLKFNAYHLSKARRKELNKKISNITNNFIENLVQLKWTGSAGRGGNPIKRKIYAIVKSIYRKMIRRLYKRNIKINWFVELYYKIFSNEIVMAKMPENFLFHAKNYVRDVFKIMGIDTNKVTVINQFFDACDPSVCFKYVDNSKAIVVIRDPRDHYLFINNYLKHAGIDRKIPTNNIYDYAKYYRLLHESLNSNENILTVNFESLIYDYENCVKQIADFLEIKNHVRKGEIFSPAMSRNNTQLFKKYPGVEEDMKKLELELAEFLFPFEDFPDVEAQGGMFMNRSPLHKK